MSPLTTNNLTIIVTMKLELNNDLDLALAILL